MGHNACAQVRSMWRSRRAKWRQSTKSAETVPDLAHRLSEFRNALVTDSSFAGCGPTWQASALALCRWNAASTQLQQFAGFCRRCAARLASQSARR